MDLDFVLPQYSPFIVAPLKAGLSVAAVWKQKTPINHIRWLLRGEAAEIFN
jgi:hypothetical protein